MKKNPAIRVLWVEDRPQDIKRTIEDLEKSLPSKFDVALTISSALRKLRKVSFDFVFLDSIVPKGSERILSDEFSLDYEDSDQMGDLLGKALVSGDLNDNIRIEKFKGIVFSSAIPTSQELLRAIKHNSNAYIVLSKSELFQNPDEATNLLKDYLTSDKLPIFSSKIDAEKAVQPATDALSVQLDITGNSLTKEQIRIHVHEQNQSLLRQIATLDAITAEAGKTSNHVNPTHSMSLTQFIAVHINADKKLWYDAYDRTKRADLSKLEELEEHVKKLEKQISENKALSKEHVKNLLLDIANRARMFDRKLSDHFLEMCQEIRILEIQNHTSRISNSLHMMIELNNELLNSEDSEKENVDPVNIDVFSTLDAIIQDHIAKAEKRGCEIRRYLPRSSFVFKAVRREFRTVLNNLLDNAVKHGFLMPKKNAWIDVEVKKQKNGEFTISIESWGANIAPGTNIYKRAERGNSSLAAGTGRGLTICKEICDKNGWNLSHTSKAASARGNVTEVQGRVAYINKFSVEFK